MRNAIAVSLVCVGPGLALAEVAHPSGEALRHAVAGKTVHIDTPIGTTLPISYLPDGTLTGTAGALGFVLGSTSDQGKWWVKGDRVCQRWSKWFDGETRCVLVRQHGRRIEWESDDGKSGTGTIVAMAAPMPTRNPYTLGGPKVEPTGLADPAPLPPGMVPPVARRSPDGHAPIMRRVEKQPPPQPRRATIDTSHVAAVHRPAPSPVHAQAQAHARPMPQPGMYRQVGTVARTLTDLAWCVVSGSGRLAAPVLAGGAALTVPKEAYASTRPALMSVSLPAAELPRSSTVPGTCMGREPAISELARYAADTETEVPAPATIASR